MRPIRERGDAPRSIVALLALCLACSASAQAWRITPGVTLTETYSDNVRLAADAFARTGWITQVTPTVHVEHLGARSHLLLDYRREQAYYTGNSDLNHGANYLNSFVKMEFVEKWLYLEARALVSQQNASAFGPAVIANTSNEGSNRIETRSLQVSPYVHGRIGDAAIYQVRFNESDLRTGTTRLSGMRTSELVANARNPSPSAKVGWAVDLRALQARADAFGELDDNRIRASVIYAVDPQFHVSLIEGYEETDFAAARRQRGATPGLGLEWSPSVRTQLAAVAERRFFGTGHLVTFRHRTPRTAWRVSSGREATVLTSVLGASAGTLQEVMVYLLSSSVPDRLLRAEAARNRLADQGNGATTIAPGFLTERPFLNRTVDATAAFIGARNTITVNYLRQEQTALARAASLDDSFSVSEQIRQRGFNASWLYRLTPLTTITLASSSLRTVGLGGPAPSSKQDLATIFLTTRLGPHATASFGFRQVEFENTTTPGYREQAVFGSLNMRL